MKISNAADRTSVFLRKWWPELIALYAVAVALHWSIGAYGVPWREPEKQVGWIFAAVLAATFRNRRRLARALIDWLPVAALLVAYTLLADRADDLSGRVHDVSGVDRAIFGAVPTVWLQDLFWRGNVRLFDILVALIYLSHFTAVFAAATLTWARSRRRYREFTLSLFILTAAALLTYALFPAAPPWISSAEGNIEAISRITNLALNTFFRHPYESSWDGFSPWNAERYQVGNPVAAVPSLHVAYPVLLLVFFWPRRLRFRLLLGSYVAAMCFAVLYLGEHFVVDVVVGALYAIVAVRSAAYVRARATRRCAQPARIPEALSDVTST